MRLLAPAAFGLALGAWASCGERGEAPEPEAEAPGSEAPDDPGGEDPAAGEPATPDEPGDEGPASTGIGACDELIERMIACPGMPARVRAAYRQTAQTWRETVEEGGDRVREAIRDGCARARPSWEEALAHAGC